MSDQVHVMALTATVTSASLTAICRNFGMSNPFVLSKSTNRPNEFLAASKKPDSIKNLKTLLLSK